MGQELGALKDGEKNKTFQNADIGNRVFWKKLLNQKVKLNVLPAYWSIIFYSR